MIANIKKLSTELEQKTGLSTFKLALFAGCALTPILVGYIIFGVATHRYGMNADNLISQDVKEVMSLMAIIMATTCAALSLSVAQNKWLHVLAIAMSLFWTVFAFSL